ncbi:MAG: response regulator [Armatimonadia bacterium]|nr:response regulator [Armatimonadia bacterium]
MAGENKKVLLVDDDQDFVTANRIALQAKGFEVVTAGSSREGLETALKEDPDLIVADLMMEELDAGFSLVESLQGHSQTSDTPIIMVSGVTTSLGFRVDQEGEKPGWLHVKEFINKPIDPVDLADKVATHLG